MFTTTRYRSAMLAASLAFASFPVVGVGIYQQPLNLDQLIDMAAQNHPNVAARRAQFDAAQADVDAARWQYFPSPSLAVQNYDKGETSATLALQQPLWAGGRIDAGLDGARARTAAAQAAVSETQYAQALRTVSAWQTWVQARDRGAALSGSITALESYSERVARRIEAGASAEVDRELVAARLAQTRGELDAVKAAGRSALMLLEQLTGQAMRAESLAVGNGEPAAMPGREELLRRAQERHPVLRRIDAEIEASRQEVNGIRSVLWPLLNLRAERQRSNTSLFGLTTDEKKLLLTLDFVPGAGLSAGAGIAAAKARTASLVETREAARRDLVERVSADFEEYDSSIRRLHELQLTLQSISGVLASYDRLFVAGKRGWLDVLNAAREKTQIELTLADVGALSAAAHARLRLHSGEFLWMQENAP